MNSISQNQFQYAQPDGSVIHATDTYYHNLANKLLKTWDDSDLLQEIPTAVRQAVALGIVGYLQDIIADMGIWRTFIDECKRMYGSYVPFHDIPEDYIEYELNLTDIEFLTWYFIAFNSMEFRHIYPLHPQILQLARLLFELLENEYDDAPTPEHFRKMLDIDLYDSESAEAIYDFSHWLFWHNYFLVPPFQLTYANIYSEIQNISKSSAREADKQSQIEDLKRSAMGGVPTGPLALYLKEWLHLIINGKYPPVRPKQEEIAEHKYYTAFTNATGGKTIKFIKTYDELNRFFIDGMQWGNGEHLPMLKDASDFVLYVDKEKGMIVAKNIAACICHPDNPLYDKEFARQNAFRLLSQRSLCPGDLLRYVCQNNYLPDAVFPNSDDTEIVVRNWDFLSRCYLQEYYRGD